MARKPRVHYEGALYHVICRGNNREWVFKEDNEKTKYLEIIKHYKKKYNFKLYSYCIMDNHVHLLIEVNQIPLCKVMQGIQQVFTQTYNKKHKRTGHVFEQRYKAIHCDKDKYLLGLINYIHMNPVRAKLESGINYNWSSHLAYLKDKPNEYVDTAFPLSLFEGNHSQQLKRYSDFMLIEDDQIKEMKPREFSDDIDEYEVIKKMSEIIDKLELQEPEDILLKVCNETGVTLGELRMKTKKPKIVCAKRLAVYALKELSSISNTEISRLVNTSLTTITTILGNETLRHEFEEKLTRIRQSKA